jgi:hypothetical protein
MRKLMLSILAACLAVVSMGQDMTPKEKAAFLAKNEFSKTKHKKKEKDGVVKETHRVVESTPVISTELSFYEGNYVYGDLDYKLEIRTDAQRKPIAALSIDNSTGIQLKDVVINDAFFRAVKINSNGTEEIWEGVFINKTDNGNTEFGLGIKLPNPIQLTEGLKITRIFLKKVSP